MAAKYFSDMRKAPITYSKPLYAGAGTETLNPSKEASAFTSKFETKSVTVDDRERKVLPLTKVEITPSDSTVNPKHIYVNVSAQNTGTSLGIPARFEIDFDQPYLKDAEKYYLTIVKAVFPTSSIPLFEFVQSDYYISIDYPSDGFGVTLFVMPVGIPETDGKYFVFNYEQFLDSVNATLLNAFCQLKSEPGSTFAGDLPPFIVFDKPTNRFSIIAQQEYWSQDADDGNGAASLSFSFKLFRLFNSLPATTETGQPNPLVKIQISNNGVQYGGSYQGTNVSMSGTMNKNIDRAYSEIQTFSKGMVIFFAGQYYASIINGNIGNRPDLSPGAWQLQGFVTGNNPNIWDVNNAYVESQIVYYPTANSVPFVSLQYPNTANVPNPAAATAFWLPLTSGNPTTWLSTGTYSINQNVYYPNVTSGNIYRSITGVNSAPPLNPSTDLVNWASATVFNVYKIIGEYSSLTQWGDIESIVIQTGSLPIRYEVYAPPGSDVIGSGSQVPRPILTDIDPYKLENGLDRSPIQYVPPGNYRMIDLFSKSELKRIDAFLQYKTKALDFKDLIMLPGDYFSIKFLFIRNDALSIV